MSANPSSARRRTHRLDLAVAAWVALWIAIGVLIGVNVGNLTRLSDNVARDGRAVQTVGRSLQSLGGLPLVGPVIGRSARQVQAAGADAASSAASTTSSIEALSVLLAIAVSLVPSVPVLVFYLPGRLGRRRRVA